MNACVQFDSGWSRHHMQVLDKKVCILVTSTKNNSMKYFSRCKQYGKEIHRKREM